MLCQKLDSKSENYSREMSRSLNTAKLIAPLLKAGICYLSIQSEGDVSVCYGGLLFLLAFSLARVRGFTTVNWTRRINEVQRLVLMNNNLLSTLAENSARDLSDLIQAKVLDGLDPDLLTAEIKQVAHKSYSYIPQLIACVNQVQYSGLTPIQIISRALSERSEVPWSATLSIHKALGTELTKGTQFIKLSEGDVYAGMKYGVISQEIKNLLYLFMRVMIVFGGEDTLRGYAGVG